jgi:hypothetical protein
MVLQEEYKSLSMCMKAICSLCSSAKLGSVSSKNPFIRVIFEGSGLPTGYSVGIIPLQV